MENIITTESDAQLESLDKAGIACSAACAAHCVLLPILAYIAPSLSIIGEQEWIHMTFRMLLRQV